MLITKRCEKCGAVSEFESLDEHAACPRCGAIFSKVEAARKTPSTEIPRSSNPRREVASSPPLESPDPTDFLTGLRASTNYPTFRGVVNLTYWLWMILAALAFIGALVGAVARDGGFMALVIGAFVGLLFIVIGRFLKEAALMLADLSDAAIYTAQKGK